MTDLTATAHHAETRIHAPASTDQGPLPYHRLGLLTPGWWRPLATLALAVLLYAAMVLALVLPAAVAGLVSPPFAAIMERTVSLDMADPWTLAASLAMLALLVPTCRLTVRLLGRRGTLDSVARRFRWALFRSFVLVALPVTAASVGLSLILSPAPIRVTASTLPLLVVALLLVPFQAAGEEYLFRGLLPQVVGGWLRSQWWGVAISVPLFTLGHSYDAPGLVGVGLFGVAASWVTWRSGGLEAAVALHAGAAASEDTLRRFAGERLGPRAPRRVLVLDAIPRNPQGKVARGPLAKAIEACLSAAAGTRPAGDPGPRART